MGYGRDEDGGIGFMALRYKDSLSNILISFFHSEETFRHP